MQRLKVQTIGSGPDLVLLHGWGMNSHVWQAILPQLEAHYTVHCVDLPGHGCNSAVNLEHLPEKTPKDDAANQAEYWADMIASVVPDRAIWIAWSLGAIFALLTANRQPIKLERLIIVAGSPRFCAGGNWPYAVSVSLLNEFERELEQNSRKLMHRFLKLQVMGEKALRSKLALLRSLVNQEESPSLWALKVSLRFLSHADLRAVYHRLQCPVNVILGAEDKLIPVEVAGSLKSLNPSVKIEVIEECGHMPFLFHPQEFINCLERFIKDGRYD